MGSDISALTSKREMKILDLVRVDPASHTYEALTHEIASIGKNLEDLRQRHKDLLTLPTAALTNYSSAEVEDNSIQNTNETEDQHNVFTSGNQAKKSLKRK